MIRRKTPEKRYTWAEDSRAGPCSRMLSGAKDRWLSASRNGTPIEASTVPKGAVRRPAQVCEEVLHELLVGFSSVRLRRSFFSARMFRAGDPGVHNQSKECHGEQGSFSRRAHGEFP